MADDDKKPDEKKKAERQALTPDANGNVIMEVIMGPYRGNLLTMNAVEAEEAKDSHWARDPREIDADHDHELTDADRQSALDQAHAWAKAQWAAAQGTAPPPPEGGEARKRSMQAEEGEGYRTRQVEPPKHPEPKHPEPKHR